MPARDFAGGAIVKANEATIAISDISNADDVGQRFLPQCPQVLFLGAMNRAEDQPGNALGQHRAYQMPLPFCIILRGGHNCEKTTGPRFDFELGHEFGEEWVGNVIDDGTKKIRSSRPQTDCRVVGDIVQFLRRIQDAQSRRLGNAINAIQGIGRGRI